MFDPGSLLLYAVTDRRGKPVEAFLDDVRAALEGGVTLLQLREKELETADLARLAERVKKVCSDFGVPLIVNDDAQAALLSGADGVHVGSEDEAVSLIRQRAGADFIIGATAKTPERARLAEAQGADYLGVGAVFPSPTKPDALRITPAMLKTIASSVSIPCVAIGGITRDNVGELSGCGIYGAAVVNAVFGQSDVKHAAAVMKARVKETLNNG